MRNGKKSKAPSLTKFMALKRLFAGHPAKIIKVKVVPPSPFYDGKYHPPLVEQLTLLLVYL
jgi:hypothetical protein